MAAKAKEEAVPKTAPDVKIIHMYAGLDLIGSKTSVDCKRADIYELAHGLLVVSKENKRKVVIPYNNIKGYELL